MQKRKRCLNLRPRSAAAVVVEAMEARRLLGGGSGGSGGAGTGAAFDAFAASAATTAAVATTATTESAATEAAVFTHPSILHSEDDFARMRQKVAVGAQPWAAGYNALISDGYSQSGWTPRPLETVIRGGTGQNFAQMVIDMQRAYQTAVRWKVSGNTVYADQSVRIFNAWSSTHKYLTGNADRFLASGLYGFGWAAAADIMRSYSGWAAADVTQFQNYLVDIYVPMQRHFLVNHNGAAITNYWANWDLANIEGLMAVGIFADRRDLYDEAVNYLFNGRGNGALDKAFYYLHPGNLMQWQESGRDQGHTTLGIGLFGHIAQMAWNQGLDLFSYNNHQFLAAAEYIAKYNLGYDVPFQAYNWGTGQSGSWQTHTAISGAGRGHGRRVYELIYNHYVQRLGMAAPYSTQRVMNLRPEWRGSGDEFGFGTLTYALDPVATTNLTPRGLTAAEKGRGNVQLDWFGTSHASGYNVYRSTSADGTYTKIASNVTDLLIYTDRNLPAGVYYYKVAGILVGGGETGFSNVVSATSTSLAHTYLPFNETSGASGADHTGNGHDAILINGATWSAGRSGNALSLDGANDYAELPAGFIADATDFTVAAWVNVNSAATWSRIFDFGDDRGRWMMLTPRNGGGVVEFATSTVYGYNKQWVVGSSALPTGRWVHVAVTLSDNVGTLYVNGVAVGSNANMAFPPSQIRSTPRNYTIRRATTSGGPYTTVAALHSGTTFSDSNRTAGARYYYVVSAYNNGGDGQDSPQASAVALPPMPSTPTNLVANAISSSAISLSWSASANAASYSLKRALTGGGPYTTIASGLTTTSYTDTGRTAGTTYYYVVTAVNASGESGNSNIDSATPSDLIAHLKFDQSSGMTATDSGLNGWNGTLVNGATWTTGRLGNAVDLDGADDHVTLPAGVVSGVTNFTIAAWVFQEAGSNWSRIFDFGTGTTRNMFLTPQNGATGRVRFAITTNGNGAEQQITGNAALPVGAWTHVAVTLGGSVGILYVNGMEVGRNSSMTLNPDLLGSTNLNYIARSQYPDPYLNGRVDDFQIYARALAAGEVSALASGNVPAAPGNLYATAGDRQVFLSWPAVSGASSYTIKRATVSGGPHTTIASSVTSTTRTDASVTSGTTYYYVITAVNIVGESAASPEAEATPFTTSFAGTTGDDQWVVRRSGGDSSGATLLVWIGDGTGPATYEIDAASVTSLSFNGTGGNDTLVIDGSGADAFSGVSIHFAGGGDDDTLVLQNAATASVAFDDASGIQTIAVEAGSYAFDEDLAAASGEVVLAVSGGAAVTLGSSQRLAGIIVDNATLTLDAGGSRVLNTAALTITNGGRLDLRDNDLLVRSGEVGSWSGSAYTGILGLIASGRTANRTWDGPGIMTSMPDADAGLTGIGVGEANALLGISGTETALWNGHTVDATMVIVRYTYAGDANLDGQIDAGDYGRIDNFVQVDGASGYWNGDFNYDGFIDAGDYGIIDNNIQAQDALPQASELAGATRGGRRVDASRASMNLRLSDNAGRIKIPSDNLGKPCRASRKPFRIRRLHRARNSITARRKRADNARGRHNARPTPTTGAVVFGERLFSNHSIREGISS